MDLDGDGVGDFLVGCFQGYPHFLKGRADGNFEAAEWLKDRAGEGIHMGQYWGIKERKWMYISQVAGVPDDNILLNPELVDWDNDGDLDLLVGGQCVWLVGPAKVLSDEQKERVQELEILKKKAKADLAKARESAGPKGMPELSKNEEYKELMGSYMELIQEYHGLTSEDLSRGDFIWLFRRK